MNELKQWALCLIVGAVSGTFAMAISPRGTMNKAVRAVTGIFIVTSMCAPLMNLLESDAAVNVFADSAYSDESADELDEYIIETFKSKIEKHILSVAETYNAEVKEIYMNLDINSDGCIIIHEISVTVVSVSQEDILIFSKKLSEEIGVNVAVNAE